MKYYHMLFITGCSLLYGMHNKTSHSVSLKKIALKELIRNGNVHSPQVKKSCHVIFDIACEIYEEDKDINRFMHAVILFRLPLSSAHVEKITKEFAEFIPSQD